MLESVQLEKIARKGTAAVVRKTEKMYESSNESEASRNGDESVVTKHEKDYVKNLILEGVKKKYKEFTTPKD